MRHRRRVLVVSRTWQIPEAFKASNTRDAASGGYSTAATQNSLQPAPVKVKAKAC
jgi:hypothetical protein